MAGKDRQKRSSSFSLFNIFKTRRPRRYDAGWEDSMSPCKVWPSDYDKGTYVGEVGIDRKATAFIAKFHATQTSESVQPVKPAVQ